MFFVLERKNRPGHFFPDKGHLGTDFTTDNLQRAQYFTLEIRNGQLVSKPLLPAGDWSVRHVELRLT